MKTIAPKNLLHTEDLITINNKINISIFHRTDQVDFPFFPSPINLETESRLRSNQWTSGRCHEPFSDSWGATGRKFMRQWNGLTAEEEGKHNHDFRMRFPWTDEAREEGSLLTRSRLLFRVPLHTSANRSNDFQFYLYIKTDCLQRSLGLSWESFIANIVPFSLILLIYVLSDFNIKTFIN